MAQPIRSVAIVGGGPAGATLATFLARAGIAVTIFGKRKRPPLIVGESLVPAIVPFLRELGIEEEVRGYSTYKPGATWVFDADDRMSFRFTEVRKAKSTYSYNVPRDRFDASILGAAARAGVKVVEQTATLERDPGRDRLRLDAATLAAAGAPTPPDLIVDATGRTRLVARLLDLPTAHGARRDTALFAHLRGVPVVNAGHVHTDRLQRGWAWRIPLPDRVSVGIVVDSDHIRRYGNRIEEQYDRYLESEPLIRGWGGSRERVTPVVKYDNYQLVALRGHGDGWALVGDAFGFVDPVFSSGLLIAMDGARALTRAILDGSPRAFARYERHVLQHVRAWQRAVGYFYDGRLFTIMRVGEEARKSFVGALMAPHFNTHLPRVFTGEATTNHYSLGLLSFMCRHGLGGRDPSQLEVR
jgi:flavin-dependent dehydrogenase